MIAIVIIITIQQVCFSNEINSTVIWEMVSMFMPFLIWNMVFNHKNMTNICVWALNNGMNLTDRKIIIIISNLNYHAKIFSSSFCTPNNSKNKFDKYIIQCWMLIIIFKNRICNENHSCLNFRRHLSIFHSFSFLFWHI